MDICFSKELEDAVRARTALSICSVVFVSYVNMICLQNDKYCQSSQKSYQADWFLHVSKSHVISPTNVLVPLWFFFIFAPSRLSCKLLTKF